MTQAEDDPNGQARTKTFLQALEQLATRRTARSATLPPPHGDSKAYGAGLVMLRPTHVS